MKKKLGIVLCFLLSLLTGAFAIFAFYRSGNIIVSASLLILAISLITYGWAWLKNRKQIKWISLNLILSFIVSCMLIVLSGVSYFIFTSDKLYLAEYSLPQHGAFMILALIPLTACAYAMYNLYREEQLIRMNVSWQWELVGAICSLVYGSFIVASILF